MRLMFPGQQKNEKICLITRQHPIVLVKRILLWFFFVVILIFFDSYLFPLFPRLLNTPYLEIINLIKTIYLMFLVGSIFTIWTLYYLNYQIITNARIVDVTQTSLLHHTTSELNLNRIQDVTAEITGIFGNIFNYGNVYVQTAGEAARFEFDRVPNPHAIEKLILDLYEQLPKSLRGQE